MIVQLSSGQGPLECQLAVGLLLNTLKNECPDLEIILEKPGQKKECYTSVQFRTTADLSALEGSVLWICKSPYRPNHGRKNWYVDSALFPKRRRFPAHRSM